MKKLLFVFIFLITQTSLGKIVKVEVRKASRVLELIDHKGRVARTYDIMLGKNPLGHKQVRGDGRTPEGTYTIDWRNPESAFYLSLHISYPSKKDIKSAAARGQDPGDNIFIHGLPNNVRRMSRRARRRAEANLIDKDWTNGCIAVSNSDMKEIWKLTPTGTLIDILP